MGIKFLENLNLFKLDAKDTSYVISLVENKYIGHAYFGKSIGDDDVTYLTRIFDAPFTPSQNKRDTVPFYDAYPTEYSTNGLGDFRESSISVLDKNGHTAVDVIYKSHFIEKRKPKLPSMPSTFGNNKDCETLYINCFDETLKLDITLVYTVFNNLNVITRHTVIKNNDTDNIFLTKAMSMCIDMDRNNLDLLTLNGSWARERHINRRPITIGKQGISSNRGESSHQDSPFIAIMDSKATEDSGDVFGFNLVYSGNHFAQAEGCQFDNTRILMGINPQDFSYELAPDEKFYTPEVVIVYSSNGLGEMSRTYHDLYRNHLIRGEYKDKKRPILINNWEATYFDFDTDKLLNIARSAKDCGIEMLVMDDGWFGNRNSDNMSLGDWYVNEDKIKGGLKYLVNEVNKIGLKFGIWFEPEMISPNSNLYREHPKWCIAIENRNHQLCRNQLVLDFTQKEVREHIYSQMKNILDSANIEYIKWDMNRQLTNIGSIKLGKLNQRELQHKYVLGVYDLMDKLTKDYPHILLENCSGGGARFDPAMLYYSPQIWASDNTDAIERLKIQHGTSLVYPVSCIGSHVSDCPNHTVGRTTPFKTRGHVALSGTFGYELDITKIKQTDRDMIIEQVKMYHKHNDLIRRGDLYRISNTFESEYSCISYVSKDKTEALIIYVEVLKRPNHKARLVKLKGLDENIKYKINDNNILQGSTLMNAGIIISDINCDFDSKLIHLKSL